MKSFLINLESQPERLRHMQQQFDHLRICYQRIAATDISHMPGDQIASLQMNYGRRAQEIAMSKGQIACLLSHQEAWRTIAAGTDEWGCVFEDDVHLTPAMAYLLAETSPLPIEPDIIRFETTRQGIRLGRRTDSWTYEGETFSFAPLRGPAWGTAAYAVKREVAQWLAATPAWLCLPTDYLLFDKPRSIAREIVTWQVEPAPCVQDKFHPCVSERIGFDSGTEDKIERPPHWADRKREQIKSIGRKLLGKSLVDFSGVQGRAPD